MTYTFKTFRPQPDGTYRYKVYNGPMVLRQGLCRSRKEAEAFKVARALHCKRSGRKGGFQIYRTMRDENDWRSATK
jgi:hypothetical protein